jgi:aryl-alcohol dehydrogenase-like predicted oxidoreductase
MRALVPAGYSMAQLALRWILMFDAVSAAIPGAKNIQQATQNAQASDMPPLSEETMHKLATIYEADIRPQVHQRW